MNHAHDIYPVEDRGVALGVVLLILLLRKAEACHTQREIAQKRLNFLASELIQLLLRQHLHLSLSLPTVVSSLLFYHGLRLCLKLLDLSVDSHFAVGHDHL